MIRGQQLRDVGTHGQHPCKPRPVLCGQDGHRPQTVPALSLRRDKGMRGRVLLLTVFSLFSGKKIFPGITQQTCF